MADLDDSPDKARRNLIAVSSVVIALAYLQPKIASNATFLGVIEYGQIAPSKLMVVAYVLLGYLVIRFVQSPAARVAIDDWKTARNEMWSIAVAEHFSPLVLKFALGEMQSSTVYRDGGAFLLRHIQQQAGTQTVALRHAQTIKLLERTLTWDPGHPTYATLDVLVSYLVHTRPSAFPMKFEVNVMPEDLKWTRRKVWLLSQFTSNLVIERHLPIVLACAALTIIQLRFWGV